MLRQNPLSPCQLMQEVPENSGSWVVVFDLARCIPNYRLSQTHAIQRLMLLEARRCSTFFIRQQCGEISKSADDHRQGNSQHRHPEAHLIPDGEESEQHKIRQCHDDESAV